MRFSFLAPPVLALTLLAAAPALAHSGVPKVRTGPELSDIALFVMAALGVWFVRRAMRARFIKRRQDRRDEHRRDED